MCCDRRIRCAHAGGPPALAEPEDAAPSPAASPPIEPMVDVPPVASKAALPPALKLDFMLSAARDAARRRGETAALPPALATRPSPEATPAAPDCPAAPRL